MIAIALQRNRTGANAINQWHAIRTTRNAPAESLSMPSRRHVHREAALSSLISCALLILMNSAMVIPLSVCPAAVATSPSRTTWNWSTGRGRAVSLDKRGHIAARLPRILFLRGAKVGVLVYRFPCLPSFFTWHTASLAEIEPGPFFSLFLQRSRPPERKDWNDVLCEHAEPPRRPGDSNERD
jgi:hypothetical protein